MLRFACYLQLRNNRLMFFFDSVPLKWYNINMNWVSPNSAKPPTIDQEDNPQLFLAGVAVYQSNQC